MMMLVSPLAPRETRGQWSGREKIKDCKLRGKKLYGRVRVVETHEDFKVRVVETHEDLDVMKVDHFPDNCGKWHFVDSFEDFTVRFVDSFEDFTVRFVTSFPGMP